MVERPGIRASPMTLSQPLVQPWRNWWLNPWLNRWPPLEVRGARLECPFDYAG
jgi:hypothetical protein